MKFIIIFLFLKQVFSSSSYCDVNQECPSCEKCWVLKNNNYCSCSFHNAFCYNTTFNSYSYDTSFLYKYDNNKCMSSENFYNLCGKDDISKEVNNENFYKFFSFNNPDYLNNSNLLCHYSLNNDDEKSKEDLIIEVEVNLNKQNIKVTDNGKNLLFIFVQDYTSVSKNLYSINLNEFINNKYSLKIAEYKYISIYISLLQNNNFFKDNEIISMNLGVKTDNSRANQLKKYKYSLIIICVICILCVISCFIIYIIRYKRNRELMRNRAIGMANNLNEVGNRMDPNVKKKKLEKLFKEKLQKKKYLKKYNINESTACSICLEEFIENESLVCITPCFHVFHYDCLHNWLYSDNSNCYCPYCHYDLLSNKPITQRHMQNNNSNNIISDKPFKKENTNRNKPSKPSKEDNTFSSSERIIKKLKKNKNNEQIKNNENNINNTENTNTNTNSNNINNSENINNNNKDKDREINEEEEENNISFENNYNKIRKNENNINKKRNSDTKSNDINNKNKKEIKNEKDNKNIENENINNNNEDNKNMDNNNKNKKSSNNNNIDNCKTINKNDNNINNSNE